MILNRNEIAATLRGKFNFVTMEWQQDKWSKRHRFIFLHFSSFFFFIFSVAQLDRHNFQTPHSRNSNYVEIKGWKKRSERTKERKKERKKFKFTLRIHLISLTELGKKELCKGHISNELINAMTFVGSSSFLFLLFLFLFWLLYRVNE